MNRSQLFAGVASDLNRQDKADLMPGWLERAQSYINSLLRVDKMVKIGYIGITERRFSVPDEYLAMKSISLQEGSPVDQLPSWQANIGVLTYVPPEDVDQGTDAWKYHTYPRSYTVRGRWLELSPWFDAERRMQVEMYFYAKLAVLENDDSTNFLLTDNPQIYIDAMLHFGFRNLQEMENATVAITTMTTAIQALNDATEREKHGSGPLIRKSASRGFSGRHS